MAVPADVSTPRLALNRLLQHPQLPDLLPCLPPAVLVRLYEAVGTHDAGSLMALTPPGLRAEALDQVVWSRDGTSLDADVLVDWLEVWLAEGEELTAESLAALDEDMLALCFGELLQVEDSLVTGFSRSPEDHDSDPDGNAAVLVPGLFTALFDRFLVAPLAEDEWDVVHAALLALSSWFPDRLAALLERLAGTEHRPGERGRRTPLRWDVAGAREARRERAGFVSPAAARGFLGLACTGELDGLLRMHSYDAESERHLRVLGATPHGERVERGDAASAEPAPAADADAAAPAPLETPIWELLRAAGVMADGAPAALLSGPGAGPRLPLVERLDALAEADPDAFSRSAAELAYLANVLLAGLALAGPRPEADARELALATTNLGLELLESRRLDVRLGHPPGLIRPFLIAWRALGELPRRVAAAYHAALHGPATERRLATRPWLRDQTVASLRDLEDEVLAERFEAARESVALLSLAFDVDACRAAAHLLDRPPRFPMALGPAGHAASRWISGRGDLEQVGRLLANLERPG